MLNTQDNVTAQLPGITVRSAGVVAAVASLLVGAHVEAAVIHVPADQLTIQDAVDVADPGDEIVVAPDTYFENIDLLGKEITLRSSAGPATTIIDGSTNGVPVITLNTGGGPGMLIEGFTIQNGGNASLGGGGGASISNATATFDTCVFTLCEAQYGGAFRASGSTVTVRDSAFSENSSLNDGGALDLAFGTVATLEGCTLSTNGAAGGGGASVVWAASATFQDCVFENNTASGWSGGAIAVWNGSTASFTDCDFNENIGYHAGAIDLGDSANATCSGCNFIGNTCTGHGGAVVCYNTLSADLDNCLFQGNSGEHGGGIDIETNARATLDTCTFEQNTASAFGGAAIVFGNQQADFTNCTFTANAAVQGAGINVNTDAIATLDGCTFEQNTASGGGGGAGLFGNQQADFTNCTFTGNAAAGGAGINVEAGAIATLDGCTFEQNTASGGGGGAGLLGNQQADFTNCTFTANSAPQGAGINVNAGAVANMSNCLFGGNSASEWGGAAEVLGNQSATFTQCTIFSNPASWGGGGISGYDGAVDIIGSIVSDNGGGEITMGGTSLLTVTFCDVAGGWPGVGNIDADPLFVDPDGPDEDPDTWADNDLHLLPASPCINAGSNYATLPATDLDGNPRLQNCRVDMGVYESAYWPPSPPDCNTNGLDDDCEVYDGTVEDCNQNHIPDECDPDCNGTGIVDDCEPVGDGDFDADGDVDADDFAAFASFMNGPDTPPVGPAPECIPTGLAAFDADSDADVDLRDFASFQRLFGTP